LSRKSKQSLRWEYCEYGAGLVDQCGIAATSKKSALVQLRDRKMLIKFNNIIELILNIYDILMIKRRAKESTNLICPCYVN
jgi:hypothetical protein